MRLGADPEVFMQTPKGELISVIGMIDGTKWKPLQVEGLPLGFTLQQDNVALEFGIPPAASADEYVEYINKVKQAGLDYFTGLVYSDKSCAIFPDEQVDNPEARRFGCEPDFNAWTGRKNPPPKPGHPNMRSAGGHVHVESDLPKKPLMQCMDLCCAVPAVLMDDGVERKKMYGKAGAYRPKPYGAEYRTLSNFWIKEEQLIRWVWKATEQAIKACASGLRLKKDAGRIVDCINNNDKFVAEQLIREYDLHVSV
jgi:hypothetical protein